jgi:hypothetical protein
MSRTIWLYASYRPSHCEVVTGYESADGNKTAWRAIVSEARILAGRGCTMRWSRNQCTITGRNGEIYTAEAIPA